VASGPMTSVMGDHGYFAILRSASTHQNKGLSGERIKPRSKAYFSDSTLVAWARANNCNLNIYSDLKDSRVLTVMG